MGRNQPVSSLAEGSGVDDLYMLEECDLRRARNGSLYLQVVLSDRTGKVQARKWDAKAEEVEGMEAGDAVRIRGFVESYRGRPQVIIRRIESPAPGEGDPADLLPSSSRPAGEMLAELRSELNGIRNAHLRALVEAFFADAGFVERFSTAPAAVKLHHAFVGGLLEHTLSMTRCARDLSARYSALDADILLAGAFLHDAGKTEELAAQGILAYTDRGKLLGHITLGAGLLAQKASAVPGFPRDLLDVLTHIILSHHGRAEFGSPKLPMTAEAVAIHHLDDLDAKLKAVETLREGLDRGNWTEYVRGFERAFFVGGGSGEEAGGRESG